MAGENISASLAALVRPINALRFHERNTRVHPEDNLLAIMNSLREFGMQKPIVVTKDGVVIAGNGTLQAALRMGWEKIAVAEMDADSADPRARGFGIADNRTADKSTNDRATLLAELEALRETIDPSLLGYSDSDVRLLGGVSNFAEFEFAESRQQVKQQRAADNAAAAANVVDQGPAEPPAIPITKTGDLWILGDHRLLCGDSTKAEDVARVMGGEKAALLNTDPPYGVSVSATKDGIPRLGFIDMQQHWGDITNDDLRDDELQGFLESVFRNALPHLDHAAWYLWHAHLTAAFFAAAAAAAAADVLLHRQIIWKKPGFVLTRSGMYHWAHEPCFFGWVRGQQPRWLGEMNQTSVWEVGRDDDAGQHPTQKPTALFEVPMKNHLEVGEVAYEPFSGSGSQIIAGEKTGRRVRAIEIEPRFVDVAVRRWETATGKKAERA